MFCCHRIQNVTVPKRTSHGLCRSNTRWHYVASSQTHACIELQCVNYFVSAVHSVSGESHSRRIAQLWAPPLWALRMRTVSTTPASALSLTRATYRPPTAKGRWLRYFLSPENLFSGHQGLACEKNLVAMHYTFALWLFLVLFLAQSSNRHRLIIRLHFWTV